ncbi:MAG: T9SS type A sorting domain-containing protein [Bacteroidetes bacterium]|nr:T9SS type A sorting domain-containing protein [Bacteroidota bacterium]
MKIFYLMCIMLFAFVGARAQTHFPSSQDNESTHVKFYPNPATSFINFEFNKENNKPYTFQIFNFMGRKVYESSTEGSKIMVNLTEFTRGIYIFQLKDQNGNVLESSKFQVNK